MPNDRAIEELSRLARQASAEPDIEVDGPEHDRWRASVDAVMANSLPGSSRTLQEFRGLTYHIGVYTGAPGEGAADARYFESQVRRAVALIDAAVYELGLLDSEPATGVADESAVPGSIFVVHGHDGASKYELVRLLDRTNQLGAVILHEQPNRGATVIEKFERHASDAAFAVVLLTGDDEGRVRDESAPLSARGRQNVVFEMGFFVGSLRRERVVVLYEGGVELPSDLNGLIYIPLDSAGAWRLELLKELEGAGIAVDRTRIP